jgi:hypothetical protein
VGQVTIRDDDGRPATCLPIGAIPFQVAAPGHYCLTPGYAVGVLGSDAITIAADDVDIDLRGLALGPEGSFVGISSQGHSRVSVRNGTVEGSVLLRDGSALKVEALTVRQGPIVLSGDDGTVAGCHVLANQSTIGIQVTGDRNRILHNQVEGSRQMGVRATGSGSVLRGNRIRNVDQGLVLMGGTDLLVEDNTITNADIGVTFLWLESSPASGKYRRNLTSGVATPYVGGTDAGGNQ